MTDTLNLGPLLTMLARQLPFYLVWLVGLILALVNWSKCPRPALLTALAVVLMFLASFAYSFLWYGVVSNRAGPTSQDFTFQLTLLSWGHTIVRAVAYGLLFWAVFGWRQAFAPARRRADWDEDEELAAKESADPDPNIRTAPKRDRE